MIEITRPREAHREALAGFFELLNAPEIRLNFHPHEFTAERAAAICRYAGKDEYYVALENGEVVAYGMLRGWDEGYDVPSLGICVHPRCHRRGLGKLMMERLIAGARARGAKRLILKVRKGNEPAIALYRGLGFMLTDLDSLCWRGTLKLDAA